MSSNHLLHLGYVSHSAARFACEHWHYSRCLPSGKLVKIGVWENGKFIGVVIFSRGSSPWLLKRYALNQSDGCELTRIALTNHKAPVSRILRISVMLFRKLCPGIRLIVSFADPEEGHAGGIYKAAGWIYTGKSASTIEYFLRGKWRHVRGGYYTHTRTTRTRTRRGKHRYLLPLDEKIREFALKLAMPYPRARSTESGAIGLSSREGAVQLRPARST